MLMQKERAELVKYGRKLVEAGLTKGTGGNLSVFDREAGHMAITPSGIDFFEIREEDIVPNSTLFFCRSWKRNSN